MSSEEFPIKRYTITELSGHYKVTRKTFRIWLTPIQAKLGKRLGHFYSRAQVKMIVEFLGAPFVALLGFFVNFSDALGSSLEVQHLDNDSHQGTSDGADPSTDTHHTAAHAHINIDSSSGWHTLGILASIMMMILSHFSLIKANDPRVASRLRAAKFMFQVFVLCGSVFYTGYIVGKAIF